MTSFDPALVRDQADQFTLVKDRLWLHEQVTRYAPDAIIIVRVDGRVMYANDRASTTFGYWPGELVGMAIEDLVPESAHEDHVRHREAFIKAPRYRQMGLPGMEIHGRRKGGEPFRCEVQLVPLAIEMGSVVAAYVRDLSTPEHAGRPDDG